MSANRLLDAMRLVVLRVMRETKYHRLCEYQIYSTDGMAVDANPTDDTLGLPPIRGYPLRYGIPGASSRPTPGSICYVMFANPNSPNRKPVIVAYDSTAATEIVVSATSCSIGDLSATPVTPAAWAEALATALAAIAVALASGTLATIASAGTVLEGALAVLPPSATTKGKMT